MKNTDTECIHMFCDEISKDVFSFGICCTVNTLFEINRWMQQVTPVSRSLSALKNSSYVPFKILFFFETPQI